VLKNVKVKATGDIKRIAASEAEAMFLAGTGEPVSGSILRAMKAGFSEAEARKTPWAELRKRLEPKKAEAKKAEAKKETKVEEPEAKVKPKKETEARVEAPETASVKPPRRQKPERAGKADK